MEENQALTLQWAFGFSSDISNGVAVVSQTGQDRICYTAAHTAVIYDRIDKTQMVLQGHCNRITAVCVTADKSVIFTADAGDDAMVVVWDAATGQPLRTLANPHPAGVALMDVSADGQWLMIVSAPATFDSDAGPGEEQEISLWFLGEGGSVEAPLVSGSIPSGDLQTCVRLNPDDPTEALTNGAQRVYFWKVAGLDANQVGEEGQAPQREFKYYSPPVSARDFKQPIGDFTVSVFIPDTTMAVTGTRDGDVVLWEEGAGMGAADRRAVKILRIHLEAAITALTVCGPYVVSGGSDGCVRFYDGGLRLVAWFDDIHAGPVTSVAFAAPRVRMDLGDARDDPEAFDAPDFVVGTTTARMVAVKAASFDRVDLPRGGEPILEGTYGRLSTLATHPLKAELVVSGEKGVLWVWSYATKSLLRTRQFDTLRVSHLAFSADGGRLAVGCTNGTLRLLDPATLEDVQAFRFTTGACSALAFAEDGQTVAMADDRGCVGCITFGHGRLADRWEFIGKHGCFAGPVAGLRFHGVRQSTRLFAVGEDGVLAEFDVLNSSIGNGLKLANNVDVGRGASVPTALALAPASMRGRGGGPLLLTADSAFKLRVHDAATLACLRTVLGPTYGGPLSTLQVFQPAGSTQPYLAYATRQKVIGLALLPLDGDPSKAMGLIAHPGAVAGLAVSYDGRRIVTVGGDDSVINMWAVDAAALERGAAQAGEAAAGASCFMQLLEGGERGEFAAEVKDYFYYGQIHAQGEDTTAPRDISGHVALPMVPNLMRALGFYPSEAEVADMLEELQAEGAGTEVTHVGFERFVALYTNHRPVFGIGKEQISAAFAALQAPGGGGALDADDLVAALTTEGEPMSQTELEECLNALSGQAISSLYDIIPPQVDAQQFAEQVLGFEPYTIV